MTRHRLSQGNGLDGTFSRLTDLLFNFGSASGSKIHAGAKREASEVCMVWWKEMVAKSHCEVIIDHP